MGFWKMFLIILALFLIILAGMGAYFYYFHIFATFSLCVSAESQSTNVSCVTDEQCASQHLKNFLELSDTLKNAPEFIKLKIEEAADRMTYCNESCFVKELYGNDIQKGTGQDNCKKGDERIFVQINGKQGIQFLRYLRANPMPAE